MTANRPVLISWVAVNNDPFERSEGRRRLVDGAPVPGPTLALLCDPESEYSGSVRDAIFFYRSASGKDGERERNAVDELRAYFQEHLPDLRAQFEPWDGKDPTDHAEIFEFLRARLPEIRRRFASRDLVVHVSPGTPSMQTIWVLMGETGFIDAPFRLVKSYRKSERRGRGAVVPIELGIDTFYKVYRASRPSHIQSDEQSVVWDPARFQSERMRRLFAEARRFAHLNVPILILGERGTGKTTLARWIRVNSPFRREEQDARWPAVACGQYSPETMRAELFGYTKGAFTGATADKPGLLAAADGDTLFLDEIGDVSRDLQRLLIKALEEKVYLPIGDDAPRKSHFRLLTATNLDAGQLRQRLDPDFLDRIGMLQLCLPPLREIREELGWLWERSYDEATRRAGAAKRKSALGAAHHRAVVKRLQQHPLPGNIRDLLRVAYRILGARTDPHEPMSPEDSVEYGLRALDGPSGPDSGGSASVSRAVARAFADASALDPVIDTWTRVPTRAVERDLKVFLADELRRIARDRSVEVPAICDVSERTLRQWTTSGPAGKASSAERQTSSDDGEVTT